MIDRSKKITGRFYALGSGRRPVRDWLLELSRDDRRIIGRDIQKVEFGWPLGMPLVRKLEAGLWEVRINVAAGIVRVLFTILGVELILLHAFVKKSPAMPKDELTLARRRMKEVQRG